MPRAPGGAYVIFTRRGGLSEPWPTPTTPPSFALFSAAPSSTSTLTPLPRSSVCADFANVGRRLLAAAACSPRRGPRSRPRSPTRPRSSAALTARRPCRSRSPARASTASRRTCTRGTGSRRARSPRRSPARPPALSRSSGAASSSVVATRLDLLRPPGDRGRRVADAVDGQLVARADADEDRGLGAEAAVRRHRERLAGLALEAGLLHERGEPAAERRVDEVARPGRARPAAKTGTASRSALTRSAAVDTSEKVRGTGSLRRGSGGFRTVVRRARAGRNSPSCQRASVQHRSASRFRYGTTWLSGSSQPTVVAVTRLALGAPHDRAGEVERGGDPVLAGQHELGRRLEALGDVVDDRFERGDHLRGDERGAGGQLRAVVGRGRELRADDEQLALQPDEQLVRARCRAGTPARARPSAATASSVAP